MIQHFQTYTFTNKLHSSIIKSTGAFLPLVYTMHVHGFFLIVPPDICVLAAAVLAPPSTSCHPSCRLNRASIVRMATLNTSHITSTRGVLRTKYLPPPSSSHTGLWEGVCRCRVRRTTPPSVINHTSLCCHSRCICHWTRHAKMQWSWASRRDSVQLVNIEDGSGSEVVRCTPVDVCREFDIIIMPDGL